MVWRPIFSRLPVYKRSKMMHCACILEPWSALQWFAFITHVMRCLWTLSTSSCAWSLKPTSCRSVNDPALSLTEDCWQERFPDSPGFCSFNVHKDWGWSFRFRRRSRAHPKYASLVDTKTRHQPHSLTVCPSDGICIRCTGFSLRICTMYMISLLKSIQTDQKPLHEPVAVYM